LKKNLWKTIVLAGLLVGSLDILAAFSSFYIQTGRSPVVVLKYIASAVFGKKAYAGDAMMPLLGLLFHFIIAFMWTIFFFLIYPRLKFLSQNKILTAVLYGIFIWVIMNRFVVPMSKAAVSPTFNWKQSLIGASILIIAIGIPLSFLAYRFYHRKAIA
jgi:hypothetical protein